MTVARATVLRAAGGVVWRADLSNDATCHIALVHRPRYDDWSLPKGKTHQGEHPLAAAVREVLEETGVHAVPQAGLPAVTYPVTDGTPPRTLDKVVNYWSMRVLSCAPKIPDDEVDQVRWATRAEADHMLTYEHDREMATTFFTRPPVTGGVCLVRSARKLASVLALLRPTRILASTTVRCALSAAPLSALTQVRVETNSNFDADADPDTTAAALLALGRSAAPTVVCCRGRLIAPALSALTGQPDESFPVRKGSGWLLAFTGGQVTSVTELTPQAPTGDASGASGRGEA